MSNKKEYNKTLLFVWPTRGGHFLSAKIDDKVPEGTSVNSTLDNIREFYKAVEADANSHGGVAGKIILKMLSEESRAKFRCPSERAPVGAIEYISASNVAEYEAKNPRQRSTGGL